MRIGGKLIGGMFGLMLAGPMGWGLFGLIIGIWVGSQFDTGLEKLTIDFLGLRQGPRGHSRQSYSYSSPNSKPYLQTHYHTLGISSTASDADVKKAYRRLMSQHHPDKLMAKGLPESMLKIATQKTQEIKAAYEKIKESRAMRAHGIFLSRGCHVRL